MKIAVANYPITYHNSLEDWKNYVEGWIKNLKEVDIAVFPEYGSIELVSLLTKDLQTDAYNQIRAMNHLVQPFIDLYTYLAKAYNLIIVAPSLPISQGEKMINRAFVFSPKGLVGHQDKLVMTPFENNEWGVSAGALELNLFKTKKGNFGIQICYDTEFPFGSHELAKAGADVILVPSCTETIRGATRVHVGARARAMENQCYAIVSQTMGEALWTPAVDYNYGYCAAYSTPDLGFPDLGIIQTGKHQHPEWMIQEFDLSLLAEARKSGGVLNYKDGLNQSIFYKEDRVKVNTIEIS